MSVVSALLLAAVALLALVIGVGLGAGLAPRWIERRANTVHRRAGLFKHLEYRRLAFRAIARLILKIQRRLDGPRVTLKRRLRRSLADGFLSFLATFAVSVLVAGLVTLLLGFSVGQTVLAFAPGGFDVMIVMAFALGLDAAYVAAHHAVRFIGLSVAMPLFVRQRRKKET